MRDLINCFTTVVSVFCDDDDVCVITNNDITGGRWMIGDPATNFGGVETAATAGNLWPHQVRSWNYWSEGWQSDPQLIVTGNINIDILYLNIDIISTVPRGTPTRIS